MARQKRNKGTATGKGYRPLETAIAPLGGGYEKVPTSGQSPSSPYRAIPAIRPLRPTRGTPKKAVRPSRGRRTLEPYSAVDPMEARAVPESTFPGTILERIVYKRNLVLFGPESEVTWTAQSTDKVQVLNLVGGIRLDFVYWLANPPVVIEPQGQHWHGPFARWGDIARAFVIEGLGFRYFELWESDILSLDDTWLDEQILRMVGGHTDPNPIAFLTLPDRRFSSPVGTFLERFKEKPDDL